MFYPNSIGVELENGSAFSNYKAFKILEKKKSNNSSFIKYARPKTKNTVRSW